MRISRRQLLAAAAVSQFARISEAADDPIAAGFHAVPNACRLRMHWYIFGPAWTEQEARRELGLMAAAHAGGVLIVPAYPVAVDDPSRGIRNQKYLSPEFLSVLKSVTRSSEQLGLSVDIELGTGWPYGGPSVSLDDSVHTMRAIPLPAGTRWSEIRLKEGEKPLAAFVREAGRFRRLQPDEIADREGQLFYSAPTRMQVKRASLGGEGLIVDHYNPVALQRFLRDVGEKLVDSVPRASIRSIFSDSLECYRATWTARLPEIFARSRGYDLVERLPSLVSSDDPDSADLRHDFWKTLSELACDAYIQPLGQWARSKGLKTQVEAYGTPPVSIASYRYVDVPVGEHYEWKEFSSSRWASSGGHLAGKPVILAEAWTWAGLPNRFGDTLEQLKLCSDLHFLSGINALYGVTYAYSPLELGSPGWVPYFGPAINHTSPCWPYFRYLTDYVNRASYVLQQGKPVADIAVYLPVEDVMAETEPNQLLLNWAVRDRLSSNGPPPEFSLKNALHYESDVLKNIVTNGFSLDGIDTFILKGGMRVEDGRLRMKDGDYGVLVLPNLIGIDAECADKIEGFVRSGGTAIATKRLPDRAWGLLEKAKTAGVKETMSRIFGSIHSAPAYSENRYGSGMAIFCADEQGSLRQALLKRTPDIHFENPSEHVSFVHRRTADRDFYFVANTSEEPLRLSGTFRTNWRSPQLWDLRTGEIAPIVVFDPSDSGVGIEFKLGALESKVFVFGKGNPSPLARRTNLDMASGGAKVFENGTYYLEGDQGRRKIAVKGIPAPLRITTHWRLTLDETVLELDQLKSWTEIPTVRYFSGRGVYEAEFQAPALAGLGAMLDLGAVRETADVQLNGRKVGVTWIRPHRVDVTAVLKAGANRLRIDVTNLLINKILGMGPIDYSEVYAKYGERFPPGEEWKLTPDPVPSGLLGPIQMVFYKTVQKV